VLVGLCITGKQSVQGKLPAFQWQGRYVFVPVKTGEYHPVLRLVRKRHAVVHIAHGILQLGKYRAASQRPWRLCRSWHGTRLEVRRYLAGLPPQRTAHHNLQIPRLSDLTNVVHGFDRVGPQGHVHRVAPNIFGMLHRRRDLRAQRPFEGRVAGGVLEQGAVTRRKIADPGPLTIPDGCIEFVGFKHVAPQLFL